MIRHINLACIICVLLLLTAELAVVVVIGLTTKEVAGKTVDEMMAEYDPEMYKISTNVNKSCSEARSLHQG